ncbi:hypothetical protein GCM10023321_64840 [Pseudonocardia eucalypti]|uniref:Uncharacterized protein n=1 Tax=Pseudonocardia eucalypti TaxID=648755 RepID=A0ABP9QYE9_9PSEU
MSRPSWGPFGAVRVLKIGLDGAARLPAGLRCRPSPFGALQPEPAATLSDQFCDGWDKCDGEAAEARGRMHRELAQSGSIMGGTGLSMLSMTTGDYTR